MYRGEGGQGTGVTVWSWERRHCDVRRGDVDSVRGMRGHVLSYFSFQQRIIYGERLPGCLALLERGECLVPEGLTGSAPLFA